MYRKVLTGFICSAFSCASYANLININFNSAACVGATSSAAICTQLENEITETLEDQTPDVPNADKYAEGTAKATAIASKGLTSDYADKFEIASLNIAPVSVGLRGDLSNPEAAEGVALQAGMTLGLNMGILPVEKLGPIEMKKLDLFATFVGIDREQDVDDLTFDAEVNYFGLMARYHLVEESDILPGYLVQWGGVYIHTGLYMSKMKMSVTQDLDDIKETVAPFEVELRNTTASFDIDSNVTSIPIEISTSIRLLYVLTFYTGAGVDFNSGDAEIDVAAQGDGYIVSPETDVLDISANLSGDGDVQSLTYRAFAGVQFNIPFVRVYVHAQKEFATNSLAATLGAKILY